MQLHILACFSLLVIAIQVVMYSIAQEGAFISSSMLAALYLA